jgi:hypothetical protein
MPSLPELLATSGALAEKLSRAKDTATRDELAHKKAMVDFAAFGEYKKAEFMPALEKGLGWGTGLALPMLAAGLATESKAKKDAEDLINHARNQVALGALGALAAGAASSFGGRTSLGSSSDLHKLAAAVLLDDELVNAVNNSQGATKAAAQACLMQNREHGVALLRKLT